MGFFCFSQRNSGVSSTVSRASKSGRIRFFCSRRSPRFQGFAKSVYSRPRRTSKSVRSTDRNLSIAMVDRSRAYAVQSAVFRAEERLPCLVKPGRLRGYRWVGRFSSLCRFVFCPLFADFGFCTDIWIKGVFYSIRSW